MLEARAFEPDFLRRLERLVLGVRRSRTVRIGRRTLGRVQGQGLELENFRAYTEGDDLRFLDWNAFARLDQLRIRTYRAYRQVEVTILVDASASMGIPEHDDKLGLALALAASLAYVTMGSSDAVRLAVFAAGRKAIRLETTAFHGRRDTYPAFEPFVRGIRCGGRATLSASVERLLDERRPPGVVVVVSDFLLSQSDCEDALERLLAAGHEVKAIHVLGERESTGSYPPGFYRVRDAETGEVREAVLGPESADSCRQAVERLSTRVSAFCSRRGIVYARAFGAPNFDAIVARELPRLGLIR